MLTGWLSNLSIVGTGIMTLLVMVAAAAVGQLIRRAQSRRAQSTTESEPSVAQEGYLQFKEQRGPAADAR